MSRERLHPADLALIDADMSADGRSGAFTLGPGLVRHDGALYGGTGLAASVMALHAALGRDVLWASTQFVSSPRLGARLEWQVEVLAEGRRSAQLLVRATADGALAFTALGSVGVADDAGLTGQWATMPAVAPPEESRPWEGMTGTLGPDSWNLLIDLRDAPLLAGGDGPPGATSAMWVRRRDGRPFTPAAIAFAADFVPLGVARAAGKLGAGSSLDNSMRFRPGETTAWVLLQLDGEFAEGGYGHGRVTVWGEDGRLVATGSQSAAMKYLFDEGSPPNLPRPPD